MKKTTKKQTLVTCWMCGGWGWIHPLDTGEKSHNGYSPFIKSEPVLVWAASRAQHQPGDIICPVCNGNLKVAPFESEYLGDPLHIDSRIW